MTDWIAALPPIVRHWLGIFFGAILGALVTGILFICGAVLTAKGISSLDWVITWRGALDATAVALAGSLTTAFGGIAVLAATPLTDAYGVGKALKDPEPDFDNDGFEFEVEKNVDGLS